VSTTANDDYRDLLRTFVAGNVEFLLIGAHALALHGVPRFSEDIDVWVRATPENAERVYRCLAEFGAPMSDVTVEDFAGDDLVYQIGVAPTRIDILTGISGVSFDDAWPRRAQAAYDGVPIGIIGRDDLIANKRATGRPKDLSDVAALERVGKA
jgi:hypothetical protein